MLEGTGKAGRLQTGFDSLLPTNQKPKPVRL